MEQVAFAPQVMDRIYAGTDIDNALVPKVHIPPVYPFQAKRRGIEGWVKVRFLVNTRGEVEDISILDSSPKDTFDQSVLHALPRWKFSPGTIEGVAVKTRVETTIRFELEN
jgi:protein TonB